MSGSSGRRALFLDRDGVINVDHGYVHRPDQVIFCEGIFELVRAARVAGMVVVVVTNQAGIGRGYYSEAQFETLSRWMRERFDEAQAPLDRIYHCPFHPEHGVGGYRRESDWRKPAPGMLLQAAADLEIDLPRSVLVGDNESDIEAGRRAGLRTTVLFTSEHSPERSAATHFVQRLRDVIPLLALPEAVPQQ